MSERAFRPRMPPCRAIGKYSEPTECRPVANGRLEAGTGAPAPMYSAEAIYAACRRKGRDADGRNHPHVGQWGRTLALAMAGAAVRCHVLAQGIAEA